MDGKQKTIRPFFARCAIIEGITVGIIVIAVLIITFLSRSARAKIKDFYCKYVLEETSASEVLKGKDSYEV